MSAIYWRKLKDFKSTDRLCDGTCRSKAHARSMARWQLELVDVPAGDYCDACKRDLFAAWKDALEGFPEAQVEGETRELLAA